MTEAPNFRMLAGSLPARLLLSLLLPLMVAGQYRFDSWTTDNGLPQVSINSILQTRDGFLWFTTYGGLVRYDGMRFDIFNTGNTNGLRSGRFLRIFEDNEGALWITTEGQGVTRYQNGKFVSYTTQDGLPDNTIERITQDAAGPVVLYHAGGLTQWREGTFSPYQGTPSTPVKNIYQITPSGAVWYAEDGRIRKFENGVVTVDFPLAFDPRRAFEDSYGRLWIGGNGTRLSMLKDNQLTTYGEAEGYPPFRLNTVFEDAQRRVWLGTRGGGLLLVEDDKFRSYTTKDGLVGDDVGWIYPDREGTFWIGTTGGLSRMTELTITAYSTKDGLAGDNVYPIFEDRQGDVWIGSWRGLTRYRDGKFANVGKEYGVADVLVTSLLEDSQGSLWIGSWSEGVRRVQGGKITLFAPTESPGVLVRSIIEDRAGNIWFGTGNNGLVKYADGTFTALTAKDGLVGKEIFVIFEDRQGQLWVGTDKGLNKYKDGVFTAYPETDGPAGNLVRSIYEDAAGTLWVGMYDNGLYRYRDGRFTHFTTNTGLFDNGVFRIIEDDAGNFWISCNLGVYRVKRSDLDAVANGESDKITSIPYNRRDGMLSSECNGAGQPAGIRARDGKIWFPTQKGVVLIDPSTVPLNSQAPPVVIESFIIDTKPADIRPTMNIEPGQTNVEIHYSGLSFINPELVKFKYKLEGLDTDWVDAATRRTAFYPHLPPGNYRFVVTAANRDGVWNEQGATIGITVLPPFWQTWWFLAFVGFVIVAIAYSFYRRRIGALTRAKAANEAFSRQLIESQEGERKRIAAELHDSVGQTLVLIRNWALLGLKNAGPKDPLIANLDEISTTASEAINEVREIAYNLGPHQLDRIGLGMTIKEMAEKVASTSAISFDVETDGIDGCLGKDAEINVFRIVQEAVNNIIKHSGATKAALTLTRKGSQMTVTITDDGKGFAKANLPDNGRRGFGLLGMTERVNLLRGELKIVSAPKKGTRIEIVLPSEDQHGN